MTMIIKLNTKAKRGESEDENFYIWMESDTSALLMAGMVYTIPEKGLIQGQ
jgi:hypothetical protein